MKVSILMMTYNHENYIAQAIESVLMQEVNFEYEVVIGEDYSTDNTRQILIDYQRNYPKKIRLLLPDKNLGMHKNFMNTLQACQGQYIAVLEGDDYWTSCDKLQKQVDFLDKNLDFAICFHNVLVFWQDNSYSPTIFLHNQSKTSTIENLLINNFISTPSVMYRAGLVQEFPDWFSEQSMGDWTFHILNAQYGKIGYIDEVMAAYRVHAKGVWSSKSRESQIKETIRMLDTIKYNLSSQYQAIINTSTNFYSQQLAIVLKDQELINFSPVGLKEYLNLRNTNLIIFPDWNQSDELLCQSLAVLIKGLNNHINKHEITLLICNNHISEEDASFYLSSIVMNLYMEEGIEVSEEVQISFTGNLGDIKWRNLIPFLTGKIILNREDKKAISLSGIENIPAFLWEKFSDKYLILSSFEKPYKLNIGCGDVKFDNWINIDIDKDKKAVDLVCNAAQRLPFDDDSCALIYNEHFLEHLTVEEARFFLRECHRVLQPGGILRIAMPSLEDVVEKYNSEDWQNQEWLNWPEFKFIKTRAEMLNISLRWWGHQWLYDREELNRRLIETGYTNIKDVAWGLSDIPELKNRETRVYSLLICEAQLANQNELDKLRQQTAYKKTSFLQGQPLVSICIPTYNGEKFVAEAINSVLCQTYPHIEIILSDDNSTDSTVEIAKLFNQKLSVDFSILEHSQYGLAQNWNFCISQAKGKYIKFLFQDDLLEPTAIEEMVDLAEQDEEIGLVFSPRTLFTNTGHTVYDSNFLMHHEAKNVHKAWSALKPIQSGQQLLLEPNILDNPINKIGEPSTVLIRKDVFEKVGLFNSEFCQLVDLEMWLRIMSQYKVGFVDRVLSHFRIHPQQQTRRNVALKDAISLDYQKLFKTIYSDTRYPEATRQQALYRYATLSEQNAQLQELRKQIAEEYLNASDEQITDMYVGLLGKTHKMLVNSSIKYESLTDEEQIFTNDIFKTISQGFDEPKAIQHLLVAMLYGRADQLPLRHDLSRIPSWLIKDYLQFLFSSPVHFQEPGDAENYYYYMQGWIDYLHTSIFKNPDSRLWDEIINNFTPLANFIPLYFNEHNLKDIYAKRGEIIEFLLKAKGYEVDYEFVDRPITRKKIRLGVLAAHFLPGSETFAYLPVYEYISRDFEVILYSLNQTGHQLEQYCQSCANSFKVLPQDLTEQANIIRADDLDILFIATNVTAVTNQICFLSMHRLARIQVTSGGSVVTTGMPHIDYYISGTLTDPSATAQQQYQEKLVKLEGTAHCFSYGNEEENVTVKVDRESLGISEEAVIFISGANFFKIIPELIGTWAKIISGVPNSVLVLLPFGPNWSNSYPKKAFVNHLNKVFSKYGIPADQLMVLDPQPVPKREEVKEYFKIADVYLDSFPFAGTTSLIEPLQVNLPVIARRGTSFRSAMGAAMVQALDVPDLVADSEDYYIQLAIALGNNPKLRQQKSAEIKEKMQANPCFLDSRSYSAKIGSLFQKLFSKYLADTLSQNFRLGDTNLIIFPDWLQPEDILYQDLASVISTLTTHPDKSSLTLLIDTQNISEEEADMLLSSLTMNLLMEDDVDITEGPEISLLSKMSDTQWKTLLPRIHTRIALATDNQQAIAQAKAENLPFCDVDSLSASKLEMTPL
ncbi:MAG: glycosyltransferase [Nostoc sp.]|uniref:glycosyltransferase n=1 Tax=Nostoc sp. TaxID=1180 RepID=UPI002FFA0914